MKSDKTDFKTKLGKNKRGKKSERINKKVHGAYDRDNILSKIQIHFLNFVIYFLNDCIQELNITNALAVHARAEEMAHLPEHREKYDLCVSRAVASLPVLCEYSLPFVRVNGNFIADKGNRDTVETEIESSRNAFETLGAEVRELTTFTLSSDQFERTLIYIHKVRQISKKYPRKAGIPSKTPL